MTLLIKAGKLIDGLGNPPVSDAAILIDGGVIKAITSGPRQDIAADEVIELPEATLLPGFIDSHVHLIFNPEAYSTQQSTEAATDEEMFELGVRSAGGFLRAGVTTVRDLAGRGRITIDIRNHIAANPLLGTRVLAAGRAITSVKGHIYYIGIEAATHAELRAAAEQVIADGADVVKVVATGGGVTPNTNPAEPQFSSDDLKVVVEVAHAAGRKVSAHAHSAGGLRNALDAGVDTIEHCTFVTPEGLKAEIALIERLVHQGTYVIPTMAPWYVVRDLDDPNLAFPQWGFSPKFLYPGVLSNLGLLRQAGVRVATGTDAGTWKLTPDKFYDELIAFREAGFTPLEIIAAATSRGADALGIGHETGSLEVGKRADLIAAPGDPTVDFSVLSRPSLVVKGGQVAVRPVAGPA